MSNEQRMKRRYCCESCRELDELIGNIKVSIVLFWILIGIALAMFDWINKTWHFLNIWVIVTCLSWVIKKRIED